MCPTDGSLETLGANSVPDGPSRLGATHGRQAPHHPSGQQPRALQTGIQ